MLCWLSGSDRRIDHAVPDEGSGFLGRRGDVVASTIQYGYVDDVMSHVLLFIREAVAAWQEALKELRHGWSCRCGWNQPASQRTKERIPPSINRHPRGCKRVPMSRILFTSVKKRHAYLEQGHWFFHEGQWAVCASAGHCATSEWAIQVYFEKGSAG